MVVFLQVFLQLLSNKRNVIRTNTRSSGDFFVEKFNCSGDCFCLSRTLTIQARVRFAAEPSQAPANAAGRAETVEGADATIVKAKLQTNHLEMFYF